MNIWEIVEVNWDVVHETSTSSGKMEAGWRVFIIDETVTAKMKTFQVFPLMNWPSSKKRFTHIKLSTHISISMVSSKWYVDLLWIYILLIYVLFTAHVSSLLSQMLISKSW